MADLNLRLLIQAIVKNLSDVQDLRTEVDRVQESARPSGGPQPFKPITEGARQATEELRKVPEQLQAVDRGAKDAAAAVEAIPAELGKAGTSAAEAAAQIDEIPKVFQRARTSALSAAAGIAVAFAAIGAGVRASIREALDVTDGFRDLKAEARDAGVSISDSFGAAVDATRSKLIDLRTAQTATAELLRAGFAPGEVTAGLERITQAAVAYRQENESIEEATLRLARAVATGKGEMVSAFGATRDASQVTAEYASSVGKTASEVSDLEGAQARLAAIYQAATLAAEEQSGNTDSLTIAWAKFKNEIQEVLRVLGDALLPTFRLVRSALAGVVNVGSSVITGFIKPMLFGFQALGAAVGFTVRAFEIGFEAIRNLSFQGVAEKLRSARTVLEETLTDIAARVDRATVRAGDVAADPGNEDQREARLRALREARERERAKARAKAPARVQDLSTQRLQAVRAEAEAEFRLLQDNLQRQARAIEIALEEGVISYREAAEQRIAIATQEIDAQIAARQRELAEVERIVATSPDEGKRLAAQAKQVELSTRLVLLERQRRDAVADARQEEQRRMKALLDQVPRLREELASLTGTDTAESRRAAIARELQPTIDALRQNNRGAEAALLENLIGARAATDELRRFEQEYQRAIGRIQTARQAVEVEERAGLITPAQARTRLIELNRELARELEALIPVAERANAALGNPDTAIRIEQARNQVRELRTVTNEIAVRVRGELGGAFSQLFRDLGTQSKSMGDALVDGLTRFRNALIGIIADRLGEQLADSILGPVQRAGRGSNGIGGLLGSFLSSFSGGGGQWVSQGHSGGIVGALSQRRHIDPGVFLGAPRFHRGGILGLGADEVPFIGKRGEEVLTESDPRHRKNAGTGGLTVNVIEAPGTKARVEQTRSGDGGTTLNVVIEQLEQGMARNIVNGRSDLGAAMERRYGLNPAAGAVR